MEMSNSRKHLGLIAIPSDNTTTVAEYAYDPAMFPVGPAMLVGEFNHSQKVITALLGDLVVYPIYVFFP
jgi:hypothetical protein